jgi:hypothetical protein
VRDLFATDPLYDDLDALIDEALADPSRAADLKARIRMRLRRAGYGAAPEPRREVAEADSEDLWDNLPF